MVARCRTVRRRCEAVLLRAAAAHAAHDGRRRSRGRAKGTAIPVHPVSARNVRRLSDVPRPWTCPRRRPSPSRRRSRRTRYPPSQLGRVVAVRRISVPPETPPRTVPRPPCLLLLTSREATVPPRSTLNRSLVKVSQGRPRPTKRERQVSRERRRSPRRFTKAGVRGLTEKRAQEGSCSELSPSQGPLRPTSAF